MRRLLPTAFVAACFLTTPVPAAEYVLSNPFSSVLGSLQTTRVQPGEILSDIALRTGLGYGGLSRANPAVLSWFLDPGTELMLPTRHLLPDVPHRGIVINLAEFRLYYFPETAPGQPQRVYSYPISIGRFDWETPLGVFSITEKRVNPTWYVPASVLADRAAQGRPVPPIVPPGPDNPLGSRAMRLTLPTYLIHGTNEPRGLGLRVTAGCIRLYEEHIQELYAMVPVGTEVRIIHQPIKVGWDGDQLLIEAHPPLEEYAAGYDQRWLTMITEQIVKVTAQWPVTVDWRLAETIVQQALGIPTTIAIRDGRTTAIQLAAADGVRKVATP